MPFKPSLKSLLCLHSVCCILITAILLVGVTSFVLNVLTEQRILESNTAYARKLADSTDSLFLLRNKNWHSALVRSAVSRISNN